MAMSGLSADVRHAVRLYARTPGASLVAVAVLAVGIAFIGAFLSLYVDLALRPHPGYEDGGRIATIGQNTGTDLTGITYEAVRRIADEMTSIEAAAMYQDTTVLAGTDGEQVTASMVSEGFFSGLRPRLALGEGLPDEAHASDAEPFVVLSYDYWQERFGGDRNVIGNFIEIGRPSNDVGMPGRAPPPAEAASDAEAEDEETTAQFRVVGVMANSPRNLVPYQATSSFEPAIWLPLERAYPLLGVDASRLPRLATGGTLVRRLPGVPVASVASELRARFGAEPELWNGRPGTELDAIEGVVSNSVTHKEAKRQLELFLAASVLLALVAALNVSLFLVARAPGRRRELGIRLAVGAPLGRVARQLATEAGLLVVAAAVLGLVGSIWLSLYLRGLAFLQQAEWRDISLLDWRVVALAALILLPLTLVVALAPILGLKRVGIGAASRQLAARATTVQRIAGNTQIAVAGLFGGAAVAFGWQLGSMLLAHPGFEIRDRFFMQSQVAGVARERSRAASASAVAQLELGRWRDAVEAIPGVKAIAFGSPVPGTGGANFPVQIPDPTDPANEIGIYVGRVERQFIDLLGLRVIHGRASEIDETGVLLVNETLARTVWGRENVIGERLPGNPRWGNEGAEIVGVLEDVSFGHPAEPAKPYVFTTSDYFGTAVVETELSGADLQQALSEIDSTEFNVQVFGLSPLESMRNELFAPDRARGFLTIAAATLVVLLAAFGFYGTQRYLVAAGRREYAIRNALGAGPDALGRLVIVRGVLLCLPGLVLGALLAFVAVAWLRGDYISPRVLPGLVTLGVTAGLLALLAAASMGPAREARRTQPALLLRED
jgi:ABC-type lipoprotein release transport system permease subunit